MLSERASENIVENIMKMFRMEWRRKPTNESEKRKFMNQHTNLAWKDMNQTIQDVYLWALGRFHPSKKRIWNKKHTNTNTAESTRIDANNIIVEPLATFHRCHRCHIYRNARAFNMQRRSQRTVWCRKCEVVRKHFPRSWKSAHHISPRKYLLLRRLAMLTACRCCLKNALFENNVATVYISFACICLTFIVVCFVCVRVHRHKQMYTRCINFETDLTTDETIPYWVVCKFDLKSCLHLMYTQLALANINIPPSSSMRHWDGCFYFAYCQVPEKQFWHRNSNCI